MASPPHELSDVASGVRRLRLPLVNAYLLEAGDGRQILIDSGLNVTADRLMRMLPTRPAALILTHGHCDHAGGAGPLTRAWDIPVYAHPLELPYLTGQADYPPEDYSAGGPSALFSLFFRNHGFNLGDAVRVLPENGTVPHLPDWRWLHTPGHAPGHISLFRDEDRTLISGDALLTTNVGSWTSLFMGRQEIAGPPAPSTSDWPAAVRSIRLLADLDPHTLASGHGRPLSGPHVTVELGALAQGLENRKADSSSQK